MGQGGLCTEGLVETLHAQPRGCPGSPSLSCCVVFCCSPCPHGWGQPSLSSSREVEQVPPPGPSVCAPPLPCRRAPSLRRVPLTVCLLSPRSQDSCSQDSSTEMVGCSAPLMPGFFYPGSVFLHALLRASGSIISPGCGYCVGLL